MPEPSFVLSMERLDKLRLGKQRVEAAQILEILVDKPFLPNSMRNGFSKKYAVWMRHPCVNQWRGHEEWLKKYLACAIGEWESRDYVNNISIPKYDLSLQPPPPWLGYEFFHRTHRSNLIRKFPAHYKSFWPTEFDDLDYYWPSQHPDHFQ